MGRIALWFMSTLTAVVLLFGYSTSTSGPSVTGTATVVTAPAGPGGASGTTSTVTGPAVGTRWGPVQVQITVAGGTVTDVQVVRYPNGNGRDQQINARALPILVSEALEAQSASIDMVSGATVTSEGYVQSLQAALDAAGL